VNLFLSGFLLGFVAAWALAGSLERIRARFPAGRIPWPRGAVNWTEHDQSAKRSHRPPPRRIGSEVCGETDSAIADKVLRSAGYPETPQ